MSRFKLSVDIGGTFTDVVLIDGITEEMFTKKVPSTPKDLTDGVIQGIEKLTQTFSTESIEFFVHGSTVALNALLERKGCKTALLVTKGFEDILELGRQTRNDLFDPFVERPEALVPRYLRKGIQERISASGKIIEPLDVEQTTKTLYELSNNDVEAVSVCFLHSYVRPEHERTVKELIHQYCPGVFTAISSEICPEFREFERMSTTVITAYLGPILQLALGTLRERVSKFRINDLRIMQSNIGIVPLKAIEREPAKTLLSGPCGGVAGSTYFGKIAGYSNLITIDMGGTSTDVCLVNEGKPVLTTEREIDSFPVKYPMADIATIGAGGGSIAYMDEIGNLKVGPQSAGSVPGPICYGQGGMEPTVTDAHLVLGRLGRDSIFEDLDLDIDAVSQLIRDKLAAPLQMKLEEVAAGIIKIANSNMEKAVRLVSIERGHNLKDFTLVAFGGAGPMHAAELAMDLGIPRVLIPPFAGVFAALGLLTVDLKTDFAKFFKMRIDDPSHVSFAQILNGFADLVDQAETWFCETKIPSETQDVRRSLDMRYVNQNYEITVPVQDNDQTVAQLVNDFHCRHKIRYGHFMVSEPVEIVNLRLEAIGHIPKPRLKPRSFARGETRKAIRAYREVWFSGKDSLVRCPIYDWDLLSPGAELCGPAVIEQPKSTIVIPQLNRARVDQFNNLLIMMER